MAEADPAPAPDTPKLSLKIFAFPVMFFAVKYVDLKDPQVIQYAQIGFCSSVALLSVLWLYIYITVNGSNDETPVWIPPAVDNKADWMLKLMGQPTQGDKVVKPEDFVKTTIKAHEAPLVNKEIQTLMFTFVMGMVMTMQFNVHQVLVMQGALLPVNSVDNLLIQKYLFGKKTADNGGPLYGALTSDPCSAESRALANQDESTERVEIISETSNTPQEENQGESTTGVKKRNVKKVKSEEPISNID